MFIEPEPIVEPVTTAVAGRDRASRDRDSRAAGLAAAAVAAAVAAAERLRGESGRAGDGADRRVAVLAPAAERVDDVPDHGHAVADAESVSSLLRRGAYLPANGCAAAVVRNADASRPAAMRVYVHPGRLLLGEMPADRVAGQLDMARALLFDSLGTAELAADEGVGFLVEVCEAFLDAQGRHRESGCYFLGRLR